MRSNRSIRLGIALIGGAFLLLLVYLIYNSRRNAGPSVAANNTAGNGATEISMHDGPKRAIALQDIPERSIITPDMFRMEDAPENASGSAYVTDPAGQAVGFITRKRILKNNPIQLGDLVGHISDVGVAGALRPGTRAMAVAVPNRPTIHDLVRVGDMVDIVAAFDQQESRTIVDGVRVLAVDVFGKDYPQTSIAMRGPFKAPAKSIRTANPTTTTGSAPPPQPPPPESQPAGAATPAPTPAPTATPPPPPPAPALTVEVTPDQANRISLAQNAGAMLDYLIVPREEVKIVPVPGEVRLVASVTKPQLAPYAARQKGGASGGSSPVRTASTSTRNSRSSSNNGDSGNYGGRSNRDLPPMPEQGSTGLPPAHIGPPESSTYPIPVYVDGQKVRTDTVLKPRE